MKLLITWESNYTLAYLNAINISQRVLETVYLEEGQAFRKPQMMTQFLGQHGTRRKELLNYFPSSGVEIQLEINEFCYRVPFIKFFRLFLEPQRQTAL